ncbi:carboxypeptidase-like regulatory domain-containing protein [Mucilaginibacter lacusdianchii]|uniref:carboxypeptidase-like regulatory domain-containing protein n=1 Tax=Mucilaginibacter lacusdianchii TaxID=2684211 RepID=UPI00131E5625|nr:carboxypeptidase-like regulatory domain-containing protein [Mucilaginibacter sp. JXJ CY 39]
MLKYVLFLLLFPLSAIAQFTVSGNVINLSDKKPIAKASIFLSNTTVGTASGDDGSYTLRNVKMGQYQLVVTAVGYESYYATITVSQNLSLPNIEMVVKSIALNDVVIKPDADWDNNYAAFKQEFFGPSEFAAQCKILNPEMLDISYNKAQRVLSATSYDDLIIENKALGYRLRYHLNQFQKEYQAGYLYYEGTVLFENLSGSKSQLKRWHKNRREAYFGSTEHYLRSVISKRTEADGFKTLTLIRKPNPNRPPDSLIKAKIKQFTPRLTANRMVIKKNDSLDYWLAKSRLPQMASYLVKQPLKVDSLVKKTDQKGILALGYNYYLYVMYTKKHGNNIANSTLDAPDYATTIVGITAPYAFFDYNGVILNPAGVIFEGEWGMHRIAKLLPVDYEPDNEKP